MAYSTLGDRQAIYFPSNPECWELPFLLGEEVVIGKMAVNLPSKCEKALKGLAQVLFAAIVKPPKGSFILEHSLLFQQNPGKRS